MPSCASCETHSLLPKPWGCLWLRQLPARRRQRKGSARVARRVLQTEGPLSVPDCARSADCAHTTTQREVVSGGAARATSLACAFAFANYRCAASASVTAVHTSPRSAGTCVCRHPHSLPPDAQHRDNVQRQASSVQRPARQQLRLRALAARSSAPSYAKPAASCPCRAQPRRSWPAATTSRPVRQYLPHGLPRRLTTASQRA